MSNPTALVQRLWNYCNMGSLAPARSGLRPSTVQNPLRVLPARSSLRDDGLSYGDYVEQLTCLLCLKMADEQSRPSFNKPSAAPKQFGWDVLLKLDGDELETHYRHTLEQLDKPKGNRESNVAICCTACNELKGPHMPEIGAKAWSSRPAFVSAIQF